MQKVNLLEDRFRPILEEIGYGCVRVRFRSGARPVLSLIVERLDDQPISIGDCRRVTNRLQEVLEHDDPIGGDYSIEVSSPGLDRPLTRPEDYVRFQGRLARLRLATSYDGAKRLQGILEDVADDRVTLRLTPAPAEGDAFMTILFMHIESANLVPDFPKRERPTGVKPKDPSMTNVKPKGQKKGTNHA